MPCDPRTCVAPSPSQAHCGGAGCHITFGGVTGFDKHRKDGRCLPPASIGLVADAHGVWRKPLDRPGWWKDPTDSAM